MKRYLRKRSPISVKVLLYILGVNLIALLVAVASLKGISYPVILFGGFSAASFVITIFALIPELLHYQYSEFEILFSFAGICYYRIPYSEIGFIAVSNASYNNNYGYYPSSALPIQCKRDTKKITMPFLTLHRDESEMRKLQIGQYCRDLAFLLNDCTCLGICSVPSFSELAMHTNCPICILEDVYCRFKLEFDAALEEVYNCNRSVYIVSETVIEYQLYRQNLLDNGNDS